MHAKEALYGPIMPVYFGLTLLVSIASMFISGFKVVQAVAAVALLIAGIITGAIHLPLNKNFASWASTSYPTNLSLIRTRWRNWNLVRVVFAVAAFGLTIIAL